ncbi:MAG TPA: DUF6036 family nucleotidyltransferase [Candidatus Nanoarchaeia archaeon]|nr:DUF6036 family nucleotidyltransferase [Candidatus Nanoarchaeia archaeon]
MRIDKQRQADILNSINELLKKRGVRGTAYLFGGSSLISQDIISRTTKDVDFFLLALNEFKEISDNIKAEMLKQFNVKVDIGLNGQFEIDAKGFTWILPSSAYSRATHIIKFSNLDIFALNPIDIVVLKCDRLDKKDQKDIETILKTLRPDKNVLIELFEEYYKLLKGNPTSIDNIRENFHQLVLTIYDMVMKK